MDPFLIFFMQHWILTTAFIMVAILFLVNEWWHSAHGVPSVGPLELVGMLNHSSAVVVDIRAKASFIQGHILGAINLPEEDFGNDYAPLQKYKTKPVILVCAKGFSAPKMAKTLAKNGFTSLYYLTGGMEAWQTQNMPVAKK